MTSGSKFGWSYVQVASDCPTKFYLRNLAPWPGSGVRVDAISKRLRMDDPTAHLPLGMESTKFAPALDIGTKFHTGVEAYYRSGLSGGRDTGVRSLEVALEAINADLPPEMLGNAESEALSVAQRLMRGYVAHYGNDPDVEVFVFPDGTAGVEAELWLDLGYGGYQFTSRLDLIYRKAGYLWALEHKTTAASAYGKLVSRFSIDGQVTGQFMQLASHFPNESIGGVTLNAIVKDRAKSNPQPSYARRDYARTPAQLEKFRLDIVRKLRTIDGWVEEWLELVSKGMAYEDAALAVFDGTPNGTQCVGMGFSCEFLEVCQNREVASRLVFDNYRPREYRDEWSNPLRVVKGDK